MLYTGPWEVVSLTAELRGDVLTDSFRQGALEGDPERLSTRMGSVPCFDIVQQAAKISIEAIQVSTGELVYLPTLLLF